MKKYLIKGALGVAALTVLGYGTHELDEKDNMIEVLEKKNAQKLNELTRIKTYRVIERQELGAAQTAYQQQVKKTKSYKDEVSDLKKKLASLSNQSHELKKKLD